MQARNSTSGTGECSLLLPMGPPYPRPGSAVRVHVAAAPEAMRVECRLESVRPGMGDVQMHLDAFAGADRPLTSMHQGGLGLALATARMVLERHGGNLEIGQGVDGVAVRMVATVPLAG